MGVSTTSNTNGSASMNIYKHKHHIVPRHAGGTDDPSNLVELTVEEHAEAHRVLFEQYGRWQDRVAWQTLSGQITKYEAAQQARRLANLGNKHFEGKTHTEEVRKRISEFQKKAKIGNKYREGKSHSEETKKNISEKLKGHEATNHGGYELSDEFKDKCRKRMSGASNPMSNQESIEKVKQSALNKKKCPHCEMMCNSGNLVKHIKAKHQ